MAHVVLVSAPGALSTRSHPVGGGVRILEMMAASLSRNHEVTVMTAGAQDGAERDGAVRRVRLAVPSLARTPEAKVLDFNAFAYARFSIEFERRATEALLAPGGGPPPVVVCNDIAEGPDFARLADAGFRLVTLFHVVVADFFSRIWLRGWVRPAGVSAWLERLRGLGLSGLVPRIPRLVFEKEARAVARSAALVVPSRGMADALLDAFPWAERSKVRVVPWGLDPDPTPEEEIARETESLRSAYRLDGETMPLMTLSRLSGEKGLELLLDALARLEDWGGPRILFLCGEGAYMGGAAYVERLRRRAARLRRTRVVFPGYLSGARKAAHFRLARLFVNCSRYEAYGLAIAEALRAGLPVLASGHYGSRDLVRPEFGAIVEGRDPGVFAEGLRTLLGDPAAFPARAAAAQAFGATLTFDAAAREIDALVRDGAPASPG